MKHLFVLLSLVLCLPVLGDYLKRMEALATGGDVQIQLQLAQIYAGGQLGEPDLNASFKWAKMAADQGNLIGQYVVARAYRLGEGVPKDEKEGMKWLVKAADSGNSQAQFDLGAALYNGKGIPKNVEKGVGWLRKAAASRHPMAQGMLAGLIASGVVEGKHPKEVADLFRQSAMQGNPTSIFLLGVLFQDGKFVKQDSAYAFALIALAVAQGDRQAPAQFEQLNKSLSPEIIAKGKQLLANPQEMFQRIQIEKIGYVPVAGSPLRHTRKTGTEGHAFYCINRHHSASNICIQPVKDRLTESGWNTAPNNR